MPSRISLINAGLVALCAAFFGLWGLGWGLPGAERLSWVIPPGLDTPEFRRRLQTSWQEMHRTLGENLMLASQEITSFSGLQRTPGEWTQPPDILLNCIRSFYLRSAHDDEQTFLILFSKMNPRKLDFRPRMYLYGGGYLYPLGAWIAGSAALRLIHLSRGLDAYLANPAAMAGLYLSGRAFSFFCLLLASLYVWFLGRRLLGEAGGLLAGLIYAMSPGILIQSHLMKQHIVWPLWVLACLHASMIILQKGGIVPYLAAGAAAGIGAGTFSLSAWTCLLPACAALLRVRQGAAWRKEAGCLCAAALASAAGLLAVNPYWPANLAEVRAEFALETRYAGGNPMPWVFIRDILRRALTWPVELSAFIGFFLALRSEDMRWRLTAWALPFSMLPIFYSAASAQGRGIRYCLASTALAGLLAAYAALRLRPQKQPARALHAAAVCAALLHLGLSAAVVSHSYANAGSAGSTYRRAGLWIEEHVSSRESIGLWVLPRPENYPYFRLDRFPLVLLDPKAPAPPPVKALPHWLVLARPDSYSTPAMPPVLKEYEKAASFEYAPLVPWLPLAPGETNAGPAFEIYRKKPAAP